MASSSRREHLVASVIGALLGYLFLRVPEYGWVLIGVIAATITAFYLRQHRQTDVGWLLLAGGAVPSLILGRNGYEALTDPSIEVGVDTWIVLGASVTTAVLGALTVVLTTLTGERGRSA